VTKTETLLAHYAAHVASFSGPQPREEQYLRGARNEHLVWGAPLSLALAAEAVRVNTLLTKRQVHVQTIRQMQGAIARLSAEVARLKTINAGLEGRDLETAKTLELARNLTACRQLLRKAYGSRNLQARQDFAEWLLGLL
jgi:hypothetical protein